MVVTALNVCDRQSKRAHKAGKPPTAGAAAAGPAADWTPPFMAAEAMMGLSRPGRGAAAHLPHLAKVWLRMEACMRAVLVTHAGIGRSCRLSLTSVHWTTF
jgi:hypothetical protein